MDRRRRTASTAVLASERCRVRPATTAPTDHPGDAHRVVELGGVEPAPGQRAGRPRPADFTTDIDNPYWPMRPGSKWVYRETRHRGHEREGRRRGHRRDEDDRQRDRGPVIRDTVSENGVPVEITDDWYAQDADGNIWYLGEYVTNYENGKVVDHAGSFEAGVDGAQAGIAMPANPEAGDVVSPGVLQGRGRGQGGASSRSARSRSRCRSATSTRTS